MADYLFDTNHASVLVTRTHPVNQRITSQVAAGDRFHISLLAIMETVYGFSILPRATQNAAEWAAIRPSLRLVGVDEQDALNAAALQLQLRRQGWQLATIDALIATASLRYSLILLTTDRDFRRVPNLITENWIAPQP